MTNLEKRLRENAHTWNIDGTEKRENLIGEQRLAYDCLEAAEMLAEKRRNMQKSAFAMHAPSMPGWYNPPVQVPEDIQRLGIGGEELYKRIQKEAMWRWEYANAMIKHQSR